MTSVLEQRMQFPAPGSWSAHALIIYDRQLEQSVPGFKDWIRKFDRVYGVTAGEDLKDLRAFPNHFETILSLTSDEPARSLTLVGVGGGSVGDFVGFVASVLKRGVKLVHIPSTWLAAIDSAHGGKNALNVGGTKNQLGTFYPAQRVVLVKTLLQSQPETRAQDAMGELAKIALIDGGSWTREFWKSKGSSSARLWKYLIPAIQSKLKVVKKDPNEDKGLRQILNLGHTWGHVLEAHAQWSHGYAVGQGLIFALEWSGKKKLLSHNKVVAWIDLLERVAGIKRATLPTPLTSERALELLAADKKRSKTGEITYVFFKGAGSPLRKSVKLQDVVQEAIRQRWI